MMIFLRRWTVAACLGGLLGGLGMATLASGAEPVLAQPAVLHASGERINSPLVATPIRYGHGYGGYRGYGGYYGSYRGYGGYYGGYRGYGPYYSSYRGYPGYAFGYNYAPYAYSAYRPYYAAPGAYYRYGYYSYPSVYRSYGYGYPYSLGGVGLYTSGYFGGAVMTGYGGAYVAPPVVAPPAVVAPYAYGAYYSYPTYGGHGCCW